MITRTFLDWTTYKASTPSQTFSNITLATGDSLLIGVVHDPTTITGITWNGNALTKDVEVLNSGHIQGSIWSIHNVTGATASVVVSFSPDSTCAAYILVKLTPEIGPIAFDVAGSGSGNGTSPSSGSSGTLTHSGEFAWGIVGYEWVNIIGTWTAPFAGTLEFASGGGAADSNIAIGEAYYHNSLGTSGLTVAKTGSASAQWVALVALYQEGTETDKVSRVWQEVEGAQPEIDVSALTQEVEAADAQIRASRILQEVEYTERPQISVTRVQKIYEFLELPSLPAAACSLIPILRILRVEDFLPVMELDAYASLRYTRRWVDLDEFELKFSCDTEQGLALAELVVPSDGSNAMGKYILNVIYEGLSDFSGFIDRATLYKGQGRHEMTLRGAGLDRIFSDRRILPPSGLAYDSYSGVAETIIKSMVERHIVSPIATGIYGINDLQRAIAQVLIAVDAARGNTVNFEGRFQSVLDGLREISRASNDLGFGLTIVGANLLFDVSEGVDRTASIVFAPELDNIATLTFDRDALNFASHVILAGQGEETAREVATVFTTESERDYIERREFFQDARDLDSIPKLVDRGLSTLQEKGRVDTFEIEKLPGTKPCYKKDFDLGDLVTLRDFQYQVSQQVQIYEVEVSIANKQVTKLKLVFNKPKKAFEDALKQAVIPSSSRT